MNISSLGYGFPASSRLVAAGEVAGGVADLPASRHRKWYGLLEDFRLSAESGPGFWEVEFRGARSLSGGLAHRQVAQ